MGVLSKKIWKMGVFFVTQKVKNGGSCKKWKMRGVFLVKSGPFLNAGCIMYSISIFLFYILLIFGGAYAHGHDSVGQESFM